MESFLKVNRKIFIGRVYFSLTINFERYDKNLNKEKYIIRCENKIFKLLGWTWYKRNSNEIS